MDQIHSVVPFALVHSETNSFAKTLSLKCPSSGCNKFHLSVGVTSAIEPIGFKMLFLFLKPQTRSLACFEIIRFTSYRKWNDAYPLGIQYNRVCSHLFCVGGRIHNGGRQLRDTVVHLLQTQPALRLYCMKGVLNLTTPFKKECPILKQYM